MWLGSLWAMVRVANGWRVGVVEVVGRIGYVTVMVADDTGCY
jgi:hypothetical protein